MLLLCFSNCLSQTNNIVGKWKNPNNNFISNIEFKSDNTAILTDLSNLVSTIFELKIDYEKKPIWVDLQIKKNGAISEVFGLVEIISPKVIKLELFLNHQGVHPKNFIINNNDDSIMTFILNKIE